MTKRIVGKVNRREGSESRLFTVIECDCCGKKIFERRAKRIQQALASDCMGCKTIKRIAREEQSKLQSQQDLALMHAWWSIKRLLPKPPNARVKHGYCRGDTKRTYDIYMGMLDRCNNPNADCYKHYGGRGIKVCERWLDIHNFFEDMGVAPDGYSIERHDVNGDYEPFNCSWIPRRHQSKNKRLSYVNRGIFDPPAYQKKKALLIASGKYDLSTIPFANENVGWWRENFGLYNNPYVYGAMPWKRNSAEHRKAEAISRGWYVPVKSRKK